MAPRKTRNSKGAAPKNAPPPLPEPPVETPVKKGQRGEKIWPKTPRYTQGPVPLNLEHPPSIELRGAFQYKCICEPKKAFPLSHFYECGMQKWDRQLISHVQYCTEDALFWYREKGVIPADATVEFSAPPRWPVAFMKEHQALAGTSNIPDATLHKWVRSQEKVHFDGTPTFYSSTLRVELLAPREAYFQPSHLLSRVPTPHDKVVWNDLGWTPVAYYVVLAIWQRTKKFDLFDQTVVPFSKYLNGAMYLAPVDELEEEGYPIEQADPDATELYRWSDRAIIMFLEADKESPPDVEPFIPSKMDPDRKPFLDALVAKYAPEKDLFDQAVQILKEGPAESEESEPQETLIELSSDDEEFYRPTLGVPPKKKKAKKSH